MEILLLDQYFRLIFYFILNSLHSVTCQCGVSDNLGLSQNFRLNASFETHHPGPLLSDDFQDLSNYLILCQINDPFYKDNFNILSTTLKCMCMCVLVGGFQSVSSQHEKWSNRKNFFPEQFCKSHEDRFWGIVSPTIKIYQWKSWEYPPTFFFIFVLLSCSKRAFQYRNTIGNL